MTKYAFPLLACAALLAHAPAWAQSTPAPTPAPASTDDANQIVVADVLIRPSAIVVVGTLSPIEESGRALTVIDRGTIEQRQSVVLSDLLATTPGIAVSRNGGMGGFTGVRIRGAEAEQTLVVIDGVRVNDPSAPGGGFDFGNLLTSSIERVEVLRGPNSVVWGSQAIGGVVNVVTADPRGFGYGFGLRGNAEYGSLNSLTASSTLGYQGDHASATVSGGYARTDGISAAANGSEADGYRQYGASARVQADFAEGVGVALRGYWADSRTGLDGFPPPLYALADDGEYSTARELYGYAGVHADLPGGVWRNRAGFSIADIRRDNFDPATGTAPIFFGRGRSERYEYQGDVRPAEAFEAIYGVEHEDSRFTDGSPTVTTGVTSVYGEAIVRPLDMLTLTGGLRHDDHRAYGGHSSVNLSAALRPAYGTLIRASYGDGFKAPTLYQLYSFYGTSTLRPETARSWEIGGEQWLGGRKVKLAATWFHRDTHHQIDFDLGTFTYANIDRARAEGVEAEIAVFPLEGLTLTGSYTHLEATNLSAANHGNDLARRPRDAGSVSADYRIDEGPSFGATVLAVGPSFDDAGNFTRLHGYTLVSIRAEMPFGERFAIYARVENLFDEKYQTVAGYGTYGRAAFGGVRVKLD